MSSDDIDEVKGYLFLLAEGLQGYGKLHWMLMKRIEKLEKRIEALEKQQQKVDNDEGKK